MKQKFLPFLIILFALGPSPASAAQPPRKTNVLFIAVDDLRDWMHYLGEKQHWHKFTLWEESTRAPLLWVVPGVTSPGGVCARTVDFTHIFPTLWP